MARGWFGAAIAAGLIAAAPVSAQITQQNFTGGTTGDLAKLCSVAAGTVSAAAGPMDTGARGWCEGFIVGVGQFHREITVAGGPMKPIYCLPTDGALTLDQVRSAFVLWAAANPKYAGDRAVDGLMRFAAETYPCAAPAARRAR